MCGVREAGCSHLKGSVSAATLKSCPSASARTGKTVVCRLRCNAAIDSIGLILNAPMSSSESWLNRFVIDCVNGACVRAIFLCRLCAWRRTVHAVCVPCVYCMCRTGDFNLLANLAFIHIVCYSFPLSFRPVFSQCLHSWNEQQHFCTSCSVIMT